MTGYGPCSVREDDEPYSMLMEDLACHAPQ